MKSHIVSETETIVKAKKCYGYIRVSTAAQKNDGISLEVQENLIIEWARTRNLTVTKIYSDAGISGGEHARYKRKELDDLLYILDADDVVITYSLSRLSRCHEDFIKIMKVIKLKKASLCTIKESIDTSTPQGRFHNILFSGLTELELEMISERISDAMKLKRDKGEFTGRVPYGWKLSDGSGSDLIENPEQQEIIDYIHRIKLQLNPKTMRIYSNQAVADRLNSERIKSPGKSREWYDTTIQRIVERGPVITKGRLRNTEINGVPMKMPKIRTNNLQYKIPAVNIVPLIDKAAIPGVEQVGLNFYA